MKLKNLKKKIRRLEKRLQEAPGKLTRLMRKLTAMEKTMAMKARKKSAARARAKLLKPTKKSAPARTGGAKKPQTAVKKPKRRLNLTPERRAQLATAMKARWAAKRATAEGSSQNAPAGHDFTLGQTPSTPQSEPGGG
jgi:hypothetical protein